MKISTIWWLQVIWLELIIYSGLIFWIKIYHIHPFINEIIYVCTPWKFPCFWQFKGNTMNTIASISCYWDDDMTWQWHLNWSVTLQYYHPVVVFIWSFRIQNFITYFTWMNYNHIRITNKYSKLFRSLKFNHIYVSHWIFSIK